MDRHNPDNRPPLFATHLLAARRDRAMHLGFRGRGDFIHREVAHLIAERLAEVTRSFNDITVIGSGGGVYEEALRGVGLPRPRQVELSRLRAGDGADVVACLDPLDLAPESQDLIVSALELHWQNDPVGQLIQMRRALRPDGLLLAAMFGGQTLAELRMALAEAEVETTGGLSPRIAPMGELRDLGALLQRAGFAMPVADSEKFSITYANVPALMRDLRLMAETNILTDRRKVLMRRDTLHRCSEIYAQQFPAPGGRIRATFEVIFLTGWAPAPTQPKPLRPGSATARLADALGTVEHATGDSAMPKGSGMPDGQRED